MACHCPSWHTGLFLLPVTLLVAGRKLWFTWNKKIFSKETLLRNVGRQKDVQKGDLQTKACTSPEFHPELIHCPLVSGFWDLGLTSFLVLSLLAIPTFKSRVFFFQFLDPVTLLAVLSSYHLGSGFLDSLSSSTWVWFEVLRILCFCRNDVLVYVALCFFVLLFCLLFCLLFFFWNKIIFAALTGLELIMQTGWPQTHPGPSAKLTFLFFLCNVFWGSPICSLCPPCRMLLLCCGS